MKKLILPLAVLFMTMSSFSNSNIEKKEVYAECDDLALKGYNASLDAGLGQQFATDVYNSTLATCFLSGRDSDATASIE